VGGYAVNKRFADSNPKTVAAFVRALSKASVGFCASCNMTLTWSRLS